VALRVFVLGDELVQNLQQAAVGFAQLGNRSFARFGQGAGGICGNQQEAGPDAQIAPAQQPAPDGHQCTEGCVRALPCGEMEFAILSWSWARYPRGPRERSAKPPFVGSNPTRASNLNPPAKGQGRHPILLHPALICVRDLPARRVVGVRKQNTPATKPGCSRVCFLRGVSFCLTGNRNCRFPASR
jgi:hypothetical protein